MEVQKIEIFLSGRNLADKDVFSKSDPFVIVYVTQVGTNNWIKIGQTEIIQDNLNPNFTKSFTVDYIFEVKQPIKFEVRDDDGSTSEEIGCCETTIGALVGATNQTSILELRSKGSSKSQGKLVIRCDRVVEGCEYLHMKWQGVKLMNTDGWFDKSDPFLYFLRQRDDGTFIKIHETEVVKKNLNPIWKAFDIPASKLCFNQDERPIKYYYFHLIYYFVVIVTRVECWDWEKSLKFQFIGTIDFTLKELKLGKREFQLVNPKKKNPGTLRLEQFSSYLKPSFMDYLRGGLQLGLIVAIDFTGSNGIPSQPSSLHYCHAQSLNQYQQALISVGEILLAYDSDQKVPCFGFGAKTRYPNMQANQALHCFPLTGDPRNCEAFGLKQILDQYSWALQNVELSGPTYFAPIIAETMRVIKMQLQQEDYSYTILLILTDGEIHDMAQTKDLIYDCAFLPLSIIIVGIGNADFANMEILDGDEGLQNSKGQNAQRDLVQFVPFRQFQGNQYLLAKHVLAEVPDQVVNYMQLMGKKPNMPVNVDIKQMGYQSQPSINQQVPAPQNPYPLPNPEAQKPAGGGAGRMLGQFLVGQQMTNIQQQPQYFQQPPPPQQQPIPFQYQQPQPSQYPNANMPNYQGPQNVYQSGYQPPLNPPYNQTMGPNQHYPSYQQPQFQGAPHPQQQPQQQPQQYQYDINNPMI